MKVKKVTCYGGGVIGLGWAANFLMTGYETTVYLRKQEKLAPAKAEIAAFLDFLAKEQVFTAEQSAAYLTKLTMTSDIAAAVADADLIVESIAENLEVKQTALAAIEAACRPDAVIASSTSGLRASDIAAKAKHPERVLVAHPFNPVHLIPLVELVKGEHTDDAVVQGLYDFLKSMKKEPIILRKDVVGLVSNRLQAALYREAADLVDHGVCTMEEVDRAVCYGPGLRWAFIGPNMVWNLGGGVYGLEGALRHMGASAPIWLADMATWTNWPEGYIEHSRERIDAAMALRAPEQGRTMAEVAQFRDRGLLQLLKYHGKL